MILYDVSLSCYSGLPFWKVQVERERRMAEAAMLERHIMQARARSMAEDEKELNKAAQECGIYNDLGLPPGKDPLHCPASFWAVKCYSNICNKHLQHASVCGGTVFTFNSISNFSYVFCSAWCIFLNLCGNCSWMEQLPPDNFPTWTISPQTTSSGQLPTQRIPPWATPSPGNSFLKRVRIKFSQGGTCPKENYSSWELSWSVMSKGSCPGGSYRLAIDHAPIVWGSCPGTGCSTCHFKMFLALFILVYFHKRKNAGTAPSVLLKDSFQASFKVIVKKSDESKHFQ